MTRKHYIVLADALGDAIRQQAELFPAGSDALGGAVNGVEDASIKIANALAADNPRFDRARFFAWIERRAAEVSR
jgi:hypothetical protein